MRKEIMERIKVPEGIEVEITEDSVKLKKQNSEIIRQYRGFSVKKEGDEIVLVNEKSTKNEKKQIKTLAAHLRNAARGLNEKFVYKLQVCAVHFPMSVSVDKNKNEVLIKNFLGGVKPRVAKIISGVEVKVEKDIITVTGSNKEIVGQTAANIEKATRITRRDRRTFQDGIYLTSRNGESI